MEKIILIKYGELTTKKENRNMFINILYENIKNSLKGIDYKITKNRVRMFITPKSDYDYELIINKLTKIFGIHSIVICYKVNTNIESIKETLKKANVTINRKMLAEIAVNDAAAFTEIANIAKNA